MLGKLGEEGGRQRAGAEVSLGRPSCPPHPQLPSWDGDGDPGQPLPNCVSMTSPFPIVHSWLLSKHISRSWGWVGLWSLGASGLMPLAPP